ncbi:MAG: response regulator [Syntrophorhabdaceae bacterium]|nr:response regulator [Syntrophorhabdaceae bacterium]
MQKKVLIVDDNSDNLYMLKSLLEKEGLDIIMAENGKDALEKALADSPDMIVSDILMPIMDGYALCRRCKSDERLRHIPFIFYTATYTEPKDERFALDLGAERFILKPQDPDILMDIVNELLEQKDAARPEPIKPLGEEMEFFRRHNEILFSKLEHKMLVLETTNQMLREKEKEIRRNEQFLNSIIENIPDMIFVKEAETLCFVKLNKAAESLLGVNRQDMIGKSDYDFFLKDQADLFTEKDREVLKKKQLVDIPEESIHTRHLGERILHTKKIPIIESEGKEVYLLGISEDITERKETQEELKRTMEKLRKSLVVTIHTMSMMVEARDPYTAGHQRRVSNLARAVAKEMDLSEAVIDSVRMTGSIHDIGKISVPAEILSKPGRLTEIELSLIKVHPQSGYDMLKDVELPYPIAEIVLQHHERLDGSGYPQGLTDGEILLEAQILSIADVVEAMASHRPYRSALGIDAALEEIEKNKGILYDADAVDACLRLFREKGFEFQTTES